MNSASNLYTVFVNDEAKQVPKDTSVFTIMRELSLAETAGVAVSLNDAVISKSEWQTKWLKHLDRILVIRATQGG
jgi:sulfur carrier protein